MANRKTRWAWSVVLAAVVLLGSATASAGPNDVPHLYRQTYRLEAKGKHAAALAAMRKIQQHVGETYFVLARTGWLAHLAGQPAVSEAAYRKAIQLAPKAIEPRVGLTLPLLVQKKWRDLERASRDALQLDPLNETARARLAHAHYMVKNYPDSATVYRGLVEQYPANLNYQTGLGWALARMGRVKEGKELFRAVLAVSPDNPNALDGIALP
ncbi:MAG: tetratricopeptide repeat protein [Deltaproteobacteria bacterium]|jgi:tetratricopeptide (TPR) repeat protein|nr:tetratricopeptide repeat protein [Deltaproteobacteria bacterium]MBW2533573.1 tetratricopeptide repeat protein [Deltaproteobacteria bacterium]